MSNAHLLLKYLIIAPHFDSAISQKMKYFHFKFFLHVLDYLREAKENVQRC